MLHYFAGLNTARRVLWCYLIWWLHTVACHFDPSPRLWMTSLGLSGIIGYALLLSTKNSSTGTTKLDRWQVFRLFLMPFCVSSFASLVKTAGFLLIFPPSLLENVSAFGWIAAFWVMTIILQRVSAE